MNDKEVGSGELQTVYAGMAQSASRHEICQRLPLPLLSLYLSPSPTHTDAKNMDAELKLAVRVGQDAMLTDTGTF